ncbi:MAG: peptide deformylase [Desulfobacterales bacterium]|nr:MAG: peptide deformylase [Desulfobacterales bacterium]
MAVLDIVKYPEASLSKPSAPIKDITEDILTLIENMGETMFHDSGIGLAAPQVGINKRIIVYDSRAERPEPESETDQEPPQEQQLEQAKEFTALINPEIIVKSKETFISENEGCLSVVDYRSDVKRHSWVTVRAQNLDGKSMEFDADGLLSVIMQHEIDHLDGILFIDRISSLKRAMYKKKRLKQLKKK